MTASAVTLIDAHTMPRTTPTVIVFVAIAAPVASNASITLPKLASAKLVAAKSAQQFQNENLAILLSENNEADLQEDVQPINVVQNEVLIETQMATISDETITELLEVLVKKELHSLDQDSIISKIPTKAKYNLDTAKVSKSEEEYELSVIIEVDGSGPLRPFAKVRSENNSLLIEPAPKTIPSSWIPLYETLRDMLAKAMQALSSTSFTIHKNV